MEVIHERCCGLDVHKDTIVACLIVPEGKAIRTFGTTTDQLLALCDWLAEHGCTHVAMESTGVYWKPVFNILEASFEVIVVNAQHLKNVPGRKTDIQDAQWIAQLLQHGLLRPSFIPPAPQRQLRELTRYRTTLVRERARVVNRLHKVLQDANIKLSSVASDIVGVSSRAILEAILSGESSPEVLAELAKGKLRSKRPQLAKALEGLLQPHHRFLIEQLLCHVDFLDEAIERVSDEIRRRLSPFEGKIELLLSIPGVSRRIAEVILAEIGADMSRFPSSAHLASWAGICPGNNESGGKRKSGRTRKGSPWLRAALIQAAHAASRSKGTYLCSQYHRIASRRGKKRALVAVAHSILVAVYHILSRGETYRELGADYFDRLSPQTLQRRLVRRLENLGYKVSLEPLNKAA